jgi:hypothetical protein
MNKKHFIFCITFFFFTTGAFSQDSLHVVPGKFQRHDPVMINGNPDTTMVTRRAAKGKSHTMINANSGTSIPTTTSGTLSSEENPSTQLAIPLGKGKKKSNVNVAPVTIPNEPPKN